MYFNGGLSLVILTIHLSITQLFNCGVINNDYQNDRDHEREKQEQIQKIKKKILEGLGITDLPKDPIPRDDIPLPLLLGGDQTMDRSNTSMDEKLQEKEVFVLSKTCKSIFLFLIGLCV